MRRPALVAATVLAVAVGTAARAEPLDLDLSRLGPPDAGIWANAPFNLPNSDQSARDARTRFALLSAQTALALSSAILQPAATTGFAGFAVDLEAAATPFSKETVGAASGPFSNQVWPNGGTQPGALYVPSFHARKALPFSLELGGRLLYLASSNIYAAQGEAKWALNEGFEYVPDLAIRAAYTRLFGVKDWSLSTTDLDFFVSKRFAFMGTTSLTPYLVARLSFVSASSAQIAYAPGVAGAFPTFNPTLYRTTLGVRFTAYAVSLAAEATWFAGASPSVKGYDGVKVPASVGGAAKLGWEW